MTNKEESLLFLLNELALMILDMPELEVDHKRKLGYLIAKMTKLLAS